MNTPLVITPGDKQPLPVDPCPDWLKDLRQKYLNESMKGDKALDYVKWVRDSVKNQLPIQRQKCADQGGKACDCYSKLLKLDGDLNYLDEQESQWGSVKGNALRLMDAVACGTEGWRDRFAAAETAVNSVTSFADLLYRNQAVFEYRWTDFQVDCMGMAPPTEPDPVDPIEPPDTIPIIPEEEEKVAQTIFPTSPEVAPPPRPVNPKPTVPLLDENGNPIDPP